MNLSYKLEEDEPSELDIEKEEDADEETDNKEDKN